jgi:hypothetical protein
MSKLFNPAETTSTFRQRLFLGLVNEEASTSETTKLVNGLKGFENINEENFDE